MQHQHGFLAIVNDAKTRIRETEVATVFRRIEQGEHFHLVDVREDREWEQAHIRGAIHIGKGVIERDIEKCIPDQTAEIILYCGGGFRSALAADNLQKMGYQNVLSMDGGFRDWKASGFPIDEGKTSR